MSNKNKPPINYTHRLSKIRLYRIYHKIKQRCYNENNDGFHHYGGRGIRMCEEWKKDFISFYDWALVNGYEENLSIDRINNDKGYSPCNCRWVTQKQQTRNTRRNRRFKINGESKVLKDWCEIYGVDQTTVRMRLERGYPIKQALSKKPFDELRKKIKNTNTGEVYESCTDAAKSLGVSKSAISRHLSGELKLIKKQKLIKL